MIDDIHKLMDDYWKWLRDKTALRQVGDIVEITTPYLDRHNDYLQIYAEPQKDGGFLITDDGYIIDDLEMSGCKMGTPTRKILLQTTLNGFGIQCNNGALETRTSKKDFASHKHNLIQAMLAVNDLFYTVRTTAVSLFNENVGKWLTQSDIRYIPRAKFGGQSGYSHFFDFAIPESKKHPERLIRAINRPDRNAMQAALFSWRDTKPMRADTKSSMYVFLNNIRDLDEEELSSPPPKKIPAATIAALENDGIHPVLWTGRESVREQLAA